MSAKEEAVALKFIGYFRDTWPENFDDPLSLCTDDCYYQGIVPTTDPVRGKEAIKKKWERIRRDYGDQRHDMKAYGSNGRFVFTERVDYTQADGVNWIAIPLVAVFEVNEDGKIFAWREYCDGYPVAQQIGIDPEALYQSLRSTAE